MASIKVALELDDSKYTQKLKQATQEADKFGSASQAGAVKAGNAYGGLSRILDATGTSFTKLGSAADGLANKANLLTTALVGVAAGQFITNMLASASATKDLSEAFGLSLANTLELEAGFAKAGRSSDQMTSALAALTNAASDAKNGSLGAQGAFVALGISMADLQRMGAREAIEVIAKAMSDGNVTTEKLSASYQVLGKAAKGLPFGDLAQGLGDATGKMDANASAVQSLDTTMKALEASAKAVKNEFMLLMQPVADAFNEFTKGGTNAKLIAEALAGAIAVIGGVVAVKGITTVVEAVISLSKWLGITSVAAAGATAVTGTYIASQSASAAASIIQATGLARVGTAQVAVNLAQLQYNAVVAASNAESLAAIAAANALAVAEGRLAVVTEAAVLARAQLTAATGASIAVTGTATVATGGLAAAMGVLAAPAAIILAAIAALGTVYLLYKQNADEAKTSTDVMLGALDDSSFSTAIMNARDLAAEVKNIAHQADQTEATFKRLGMAVPSGSAGGGRGGTAGIPVNPLMTGAPANLQAAAEQGLKNQLETMKLTNAQAVEKLKLQAASIGLGEAEKTVTVARLDFEQKRALELLKINGQIATMQIQAANEVEGGKKYGGQIAILEQQRRLIMSQKDETSGLAQQVVLATQAEATRLMYIEMQTKASTTNKDLLSSIADFSRSEDDRKLGAIQRQIDAEAELAVTKRQAQLGNTPIGDQERTAIITRVNDGYRQVLGTQRELNSATREHNAMLFAIELQNSAVADSIKLQGDMAKLTQNADQQKITDLNTQLEILARQEVVKRQGLLAPGQTLDETAQIAIRKQVFDANKGVIEQTQAAIDKSREFSTGWASAFNNYKNNASNAATEAQTYFDTFTKGIEDAFVRFVSTGKLSFKDLANSIIADFARMQAKKMISGLFGASGGSGASSGGAGDNIIGSLINWGKGFLGFANGGNPPVNVASIVGEKGPEIFMPKTAGTIIPNSQIGSSSTTNVTYNIQATDAASFQQLLARDPSFLHAVAEKGRRSLPQGAMR